MITYSTDDISSGVSWATVSDSASGLFTLHREVPQLKQTVQLVVANRYLGDGNPKLNILDDPEAQSVWLKLQDDNDYRQWMEFGNHGYYHSPWGDPDVNHHEFNGSVNSKAYDVAWDSTVFSQARLAYDRIGLRNEEITVMRFPGFAYTQQALQALVANDFIAFNDFKNATGTEKWILLPNGEFILQIPDIVYLFQTEEPKLLKKIQNLEVNQENYRSDETFVSAQTNLLTYVDYVSKTGGVVSFFDHWWEHNLKVNGFNYRMEMLKGAISYLIQMYGNDQVWWGFTSEFARFSYVKKFMEVKGSWLGGKTLRVSFNMKRKWRKGWDMPISWNLNHAKLPDILANKPVKEIYWKNPEMSAMSKLDSKYWWTERGFTYITFPFSGPSTELTVAFAD